MENPASWTELTHKIDEAIRQHKAAQDSGVIGGSLPMYIQTTVIEPAIHAALEQAAKLCDSKGSYLGPCDYGEDDWEARHTAKELADKIRNLPVSTETEKSSVEPVAWRGEFSQEYKMATEVDDTLDPCDDNRHEACRINECTCLCHESYQSIITRISIAREDANRTIKALVSEVRRRSLAAYTRKV